jgi:GNAT superfamily N-acetyltransferase
MLPFGIQNAFLDNVAFADTRSLPVLEGISTLPSHAGKGLAKTLVSWIFPRADREGRICFLCASPMGYGLYRKLGFEEVGGPGSIVEVDRSEWGGSGVHRHIAMVRYPVGWTAAGERVTA